MLIIYLIVLIKQYWICKCHWSFLDFQQLSFYENKEEKGISAKILDSFEKIPALT